MQNYHRSARPKVTHTLSGCSSQAVSERVNRQIVTLDRREVCHSVLCTYFVDQAVLHVFGDFMNSFVHVVFLWVTRSLTVPDSRLFTPSFAS